jgi:starch synthase
MKIVIAASEVVPFAKTGGLADVTGALPVALEDVGQEVVVVMPRYKSISESKFKIRRVSDGISSSVTGSNIKVYFIENEKYFSRDGLYGDKTADYPDRYQDSPYRT